MSDTLDLDLTLVSDRFSLRVSWSTAETALGIFGPSGAGKTTILEAIAGLRSGLRGRIAVHGRTFFDSERGVCLPPERRGVGYVPQDARLFPHRDVRGNVLAGHRRAAGAMTRRLPPARVLEVLELTDLQGADVRSLSGGERQRVALARALCSGPDLLLMDEPLAGLDTPLRWRILPYLVKVQREFDIPTLHVSHDATEIRALCRQALVLSGGRELARGRPDALFVDPVVLPMARHAGFENLLRGSAVESVDGSAAVQLEQGVRWVIPGRDLRPGGEALFTVRADDLILAVERPTGLSAQNIVAGTIGEIREHGPEGDPDQPVWVLVTIGPVGAPLVAQVTTQACRQLQLAVGRSIHVVCKAQSCRLLAMS